MTVSEVVWLVLVCVPVALLCTLSEAYARRRNRRH